MAYTVTNNPWKSQYPINTGTETVTAQLNVAGVPDGNRYTAYFDDGVNNNMVIQHASGRVHLRVNGANAMQLGTAGVERMRIAADGKVGINHTAPLAEGLTIGGIDGYTAKGIVLSSSTSDSVYTHEITSAFSSNASGSYMNFNINSGSGSHEDSVMILLGNNRVGIGDGAADYTLHVHGTFYSSGSSMDYKQEVQDYKPNTDAIMQLRPIHYEYTDEYKHYGRRLENNSPQIGLVAEEVAKVMPELAITLEEDGKEVVRNVDYEKLTVVLLSEVQELKREIKSLKNKI